VAEATGDGPGPTDAEGPGWVDGTGDADAVGDGKGLAALDPGEALGDALGSGTTVQPVSAATINRLAAEAGWRR